MNKKEIKTLINGRDFDYFQITNYFNDHTRKLFNVKNNKELEVGEQVSICFDDYNYKYNGEIEKVFKNGNVLVYIY